jgi:hypothetical protein
VLKKSALKEDLPMLNSPILEVIVGLVFVYSLVAILLTEINTVITNLFNTRAKHLKNGLYELLTDPMIRAKFLAHPLIRLVPQMVSPNETMSAQAAQSVASQPTTHVNNIPSDLFSRVLTDIVTVNPLDQIYGPVAGLIDSLLTGAEKAQLRELLHRVQYSGLGISDLQTAIGNLTDPTRQQQILAALTQANTLRVQFEANASAAQFDGLLQGIRQIQNPALQDALNTLLSSVHNIQDAEGKLQLWFDSNMDRLSDLYKRNIQYLSLIIGAVLAILLNIDSLQLASTLWGDPTLRETVASSAQAAAASGQLASQIAQPTPEGLSQGAPGSVVPEATPADTTAQQIGASSQAALNTAQSLQNLQLPIGWVITPTLRNCDLNEKGLNPCDDLRNYGNFGPGNNPYFLSFIIRKLIGWGLTVIAVSQGAPFWFDLLNRLSRGG